MSARRFYGLLIVVLLLAGVGIPALFGFLQAKATEIGVNDLLESSTQFDSTNIANSTYFVAESANFYDNDTTTIYSEDLVLDDLNNIDIALADTTNSVGTTPTKIDEFVFWINLNKTAIENVDKIVIRTEILDPATADLDNTKLEVRLHDAANQMTNVVFDEIYNATDAYNNSKVIEIVLDPIKKLKISAFNGNPQIKIRYYTTSNANELDNVVAGYRVELYKTKKVDSNLISNSMLAVSGFVMIIGAFAASPWWNPTRQDSRTRKILGKVRKIGRKRR